MALISLSSKQTWAFLKKKAEVILLGIVTSVFSKGLWPSVIKLLDVKL